ALVAFAGSSEVATTPAPTTNAVFTAPSVMRSAAFIRTVGVETVANVDNLDLAQPAATATDQPAAAVTPDQRSDFWASLHVDRNVLAMAPGETTTLHVFADAAIPSGDGE